MARAAPIATAAKVKKNKRSSVMALVRIFHHRDGALIEAKLHLLGSGQAAGGHRFEKFLAGIDGLGAVRKGKLVVISQHDAFGGTGIFAIATENAKQHVDLVSAGIALAGREALVIGILRGLHENGVPWAGCRT